MQARTGARAAETAALLDEFGMELSTGGLVVMTNFAKAENPCIHHGRVPVAVVAMALASPTFARGRFPKLRLVDVVAKTASMDGAEKRALAAVCGASVEGLPEGSGCAPAFAAHLVDVIARYQLDAFFTRDPSRSINGIDVRPGGVDRRTDAVDPKAMTEWRRAYNVASTVPRMMVATILCLYRGEADELWLARLPSNWHAADAVAALNDDGALAIGAGWLRCIQDGKSPGSARRIGHDQHRA